MSILISNYLSWDTKPRSAAGSDKDAKSKTEPYRFQIYPYDTMDAGATNVPAAYRLITIRCLISTNVRVW
jgi:hypothetical protein